MRNRTTERAVRAYRRHYDIPFIIGEMFYKQIERSKNHSYKSVHYTKDELIEWVLSHDSTVYDLFTTWIKSGHKKHLRPSIDRIDATKGYSFDNIQLITWGENNSKGKNENSTTKPVLQFTREGIFIKEYESAVAASLAVAPHLKNHKKSKIYNVLNNKKHYNTFYGYKFQYKESCRHE